MKWLIRLYPRSWRERYGEEFEAMLQQRPARPRDVFDILRSALDARIFRYTGRAWRTREELLSRRGEHAMRVKITVAALSTALAAAALVLAARVAGFGPFGQTTAAPAAWLYALSQSHGVRLLPLDAPQLTSIRHDRAIAIGKFDGQSGPAEVLQSDDGSMVAAIWKIDRDTGAAVSDCSLLRTDHCFEAVRTFSARTGALQASFRLTAGLEVEGLSGDGTRLFGSRDRQVRTRRGWQAWDTWNSVSTADGRTVSKLDLPTKAVLPILEICPKGRCSPLTVYDASRDRLYVVETNWSRKSVTRWAAPRLVEYDLASSRQVASLVLKGVAYGSWRQQSWTPGFALSPDGQQIAVYDGRTGRLTVVDAQRMRILRSQSVSLRQSLMGRVAQWLGIEPTDALAKGVQDGAALQMRYSPDGRLLYVTGVEYALHPASFPSIGIRAVDVAKGEITGEALRGFDCSWMQPAPDGSALYALSLTGNYYEPFPTIFRLDPATLQVAVKRVVTLHDAHPRYYVLATVGH